MADASEVVARLEAAMGLGFTLSEAVQKALGRSLTAWAEDHGHRQNEVTMCLRAYHQRTYSAIRDELARDLGITREEIDRLIDGQTPGAAPEQPAAEVA